jgi:hypothetical protein
MNRVTAGIAAAIGLASLASGPAEAQRGSRMISAGGHAGPAWTAPRQRMFYQRQMPVQGPALTGTRRKAGVKAQLMYTVGHISGEPSRHRSRDVTLKRGVVGSRHPDFLWMPRSSR